MIKLTVFNEPLVLRKSTTKRRSKTPSDVPSARSVHRSRANVRDLCLCNKYELFCTFTFDPKRYNSHNIQFCRQYMMNWLRNTKKRNSPALAYLVIPELHKSGAIHFHALFRGYEGKLVESGVMHNGRMIYNIPGWRFGFSTCSKIDNHEVVAKYVSKYITKDMITFGGKKRYFCSQSLARPKRVHNVDLSSLQNLAPLFRQAIVENSIANSDAEYITISKKDLDAYGIHVL